MKTKLIKKYKNGESFFSLTIINEDAGRTPSGDRLVECVCLCGNKAVTRCSYLGSGHTKSCGCLEGTKTKKHGMYKSKEYTAWQGMIQRCVNKNNHFYSECGAKGIVVHDCWMDSFDMFIADVGRSPDGCAVLCRIDVTKNYSPGNVYWGSGEQRIFGRKKWSGTSSRYKGVYWRADKGMWTSQIKIGDKKIHLGYFRSEIDAYKAFCEAHIKYRGVAVKHGEII